jgi:hypothetical protein
MERWQEPTIRTCPEPNESIWIQIELKVLATFITECIYQTLWKISQMIADSLFIADDWACGLG